MKCLASIADQKFDPNRMRVIMVDDASTDDTITVIERFHARFDRLGIRSEYHRNAYNLMMPHNLVEYCREGDPEEVIFLLDADDWLPHPQALYNLDMHYYEHDELWLTYGSYLKYPDPFNTQPQALPYDEDTIDRLEFRREQPRYNHPITFRRKLFNQISDGELQYDTGGWFNAAYDHALMMPMLELTSRGRYFKWVPDFLYVYNDENPLSEVHITTEGNKVHEVVNSRERRVPL